MRGEDALHISQQLDGINNPELYFLKIKELTSAGQMVDNIDSVMKLVGFAMRGPSSDHAQDYKEFNRLQSKVLQIVPAITVANICSVLYMNLLNDKFARVVTDVSSKADFTTTADIYKMVHATAQQKNLTSAAYAQRTGAALLTDDAALLTSGGQKGKGKKSGSQGGNKGGQQGKHHNKGGGRQQNSSNSNGGGRQQNRGNSNEGARTTLAKSKMD